MPSETCRRDIVGTYARHLTEGERRRVAAATEGMSGRDLRDVAEATERRWASKLIRGVVVPGPGTVSRAGVGGRDKNGKGTGEGSGEDGPPPLPPAEEYLVSAAQRRRTHAR